MVSNDLTWDKHYEYTKLANRPLCQLMASPDVMGSEDPLKTFSEALLNFYAHYCQRCSLISMVQIPPSGNQLRKYKNSYT